MKILFIHEVNYETKVIFEMHEFPELLALRGHEIHFLHFPERMGWKNRKFRSELREIKGRAYPQARITLITPPTLGGSFIDRLISTVTSIPLLHWILKEKRYDAIVLMSVPTTGWQTALLAKRYKTPIIFRALDVSHLLRSEISKRLVFWAERIVYRNVKAISANNSALAEYCTSHNAQHVPVFVNVPPLDLDHFSSAHNSEIERDKYGLTKSDFLVLFMGTLYEFSGLSQVIDEVKIRENEDFKLVIVGGGKDEEKLRKKVLDLALSDKVIFTGVVPYQHLPQVLGIADVAINSFVPSLVTNVAFPHKVLQYLASGIITVSTKLNGLYSSLGDESGIYWVDSTKEVLDKALSLKSVSQDEKFSRIQQGKNLTKSKFDKANAVSAFEETIKNLKKL